MRINNQSETDKSTVWIFPSANYLIRKMNFLFAAVFCLLSVNSISQVNIDSLRKIWDDPEKNDTTRLKAMSIIAWDGYLYSDPDSSFYCSEIIYDFAKRVGNPKYMSKALSTQGATFYVKGDYKKAIEYFKKSLNIDEKTGRRNEAANTCTNIAIMYSTIGDFIQAVDYNLKSLKLNEMLKDSSGIADAYMSLGNVYYSQENFSKSIGFYEKAFELSKRLKDKAGEARSLINLAVCYGNLGDVNKEKEYLLRAKSIILTLDNQKMLPSLYNNLGMVYQRENEYDSALYFFNESIRLNEINKNLTDNPIAYNNIGNNYFLQGNYQKALEYSLKALYLASEGDIQSEYNIFYSLYRTYKAVGQSQKALEFHEKYLLVSDSIKSEDSKNEILRKEFEQTLQKKADSVKTEQEKQELIFKTEQQQKDELAAKDKMIRNSIIAASIGGLVMVVFFAFSLSKRLRITKKQNRIIQTQKEIVEQKNKEITDSINYAKRIQAAILPPDRLIKEYLSDSFVIYKPKDIVAGDFYWMETIQSSVSSSQSSGLPTTNCQLILFAVADCTGHGVPGAMVSVVCHNALNRSVREFKLIDPGKILDKTTEIVISEFEKSDEDVKDGMDISLCSLNIKRMELGFSGANNPAWIARKGEIIEIKADKQPVGKHFNRIPFTTHTVPLEKGDSIYIFSDGLCDQFGGDKGKKFKAKALRELILSLQNKSLTDQRIFIDKIFEDWKGGLEQIDDVCVIGVRV